MPHRQRTNLRTSRSLTLCVERTASKYADVHRLPIPQAITMLPSPICRAAQPLQPYKQFLFFHLPSGVNQRKWRYLKRLQCRLLTNGIVNGQRPLAGDTHRYDYRRPKWCLHGSHNPIQTAAPGNILHAVSFSILTVFKTLQTLTD